MGERYRGDLELGPGIHELDILPDRLEGIKVAISGWYRTQAGVHPDNMPEHIERETYWEYWMDDFKMLVDDVYEQNRHSLKLVFKGPSTGRILSKSDYGEEEYAIYEAIEVEEGSEFTIDFAQKRSVNNASGQERPAPARYYGIEQLYAGDREKGLALSMAQLARLLEENTAELKLAGKD